VQRRGWALRRTFAVLTTTVVLVASGLVAGTGAVVLGPVQSASAADTPFPILPVNATWLQTVNAWRAASDIAPVTEDALAYSAGDLAHSTYIVETGEFGHDEAEFLDPPTNSMPNPWYSADGALAGANGNVAASSDATKTDRHFVDQWMTAPFHAAGVLDPMLVTSGFGSYRKVGATPFPAAATMEVIRGRTGLAATTPTLFPGNNSALPVLQQAYHGGESPDPLSPCAGYNPGTGPISTGTPLFALLPNAPDVASTTTATVTRDGAAVDSCVYDENSYTNTVVDDQTLGRQVLASRHQVVVVPRLPLVPGSDYEVSISVTYAGELTPTVTSWEFSADSLPTVSAGNASVVEGNARARLLRVTVTLSKPSTEPVSVAYATVPETAVAGTDYVAKTGTLTIPPGGTSAVVSVQVKGDKTREPQETFTVMLSSPQNARIWRKRGIATIINDDSPTKPAVQVSIGSASLVEGNSGTRALRFAVTLSASSPTHAVKVDYATKNATADDNDFKPVSGTLTIPARAVSGVVLVRIKPDTVGEDTEKFTVRLSNPSGAVMHPTRFVGTGTISDDD
jgi:Calx-beta domain